MAAELNIYLKKKSEPVNKNNLICLFWLSTTPTRELDVLPCTTKFMFDDDEKEFIQPFTKELYDEVIDFYNTEIQKCKDSIHSLSKKIEKLENSINSIKTVKVYDRVRETIEDYYGDMDYLQEVADNYTQIREQFIFAYATLECNSEYRDGEFVKLYELVYSKS